ncbi:hypothetical protein AWC38_SpisGene25758 [Stylophora pistillata]|uniref:Helix-turn-helix domain-containing protein n=1 Tax=Stylophora pistillata TaxID=50429 RepID=A0A2B4S8C7_STYPI|nr:hypothetical protein AWC38_SpisGene25758 [Stylophora pistillata]
MRVLERIFQLIVLTTILIFVLYTEILDKILFKPLVWKRYVDDIFSLWSPNKATVERFIEKANNHHPTIKFTAEISDKETTFLETYIHKGERFEKDAILDVRTHFKQSETFQYAHCSSCHPQGVKKGFIKGEALRLLRTNSSQTIFEEKIANFKAHLLKRGYPEALINTTLSEVNFKNRKLALQQKPKTNQRILPFITQYQPPVPNLKQILMRHWHLIETKPVLSELYENPPLVS